MKPKLLITLITVLLIQNVLVAQTNLTVDSLQVQTKPVINIIPEPYEVVLGEGYIDLPQNIYILVDTSFFNYINEIEDLQQIFEKIPNIHAEILFEDFHLSRRDFKIRLIKDTLTVNPEEYELDIHRRGIFIKSSSSTGIFYATQSLKQLLLDNYYRNKTAKLPVVRIHDKPRYSFRSLMLDPARHFLPVSELERYIDAMAMYKFNRLHLHLTDDQGWRVEIKSLPNLAKTGSVRRETNGDKTPHKGYYTQEQLKYIVKYAAERHIEIIPEIEMPGHNVATLAAFPQLSCTQKLLNVATSPGVSKEILCAGNSQVYDLIEVVIEELAPIFPSKYFHVGGDEVPLDNWKKCPKCQRAIRNNKLKNEQELMSYFFNRVGNILKEYNKEPMFWYELDVPGYPKSSTMYAWRLGTSKEVIEKANKNGYKLVCAPGEHAYFDYPQWKGDIPQTNWMPVLTLENTYQFEPAMDLPESQTGNILGVEACLWGEYIPNIERAFYMTFPRAIAMSEVGWSRKDSKDWNIFKSKLEFHLEYLMKQGVNYRVPAELYQNLE